MAIALDTSMLSNDRRYAIGLDLGGTNLKYGILSDRGEVVYSNVRPAQTQGGCASVLNVMKEAAFECVMFAKKENFVLEAIGAGCPGTIDSLRGISLGPTPHIPGWENADIGRALRESANLPAYIDNDGNFMAFGEYAWGSARGAPTAVGITIGTGVGGGIILNGRIHHGGIFNAAEVGHVVVETNGRPCACGNRGCLERYAGGKYLVEDVVADLAAHPESALSRHTPAAITPRTIFEAAHSGDELATRVTDQMILYLGAGLSSIVNVLNPDVIVIGGGVADAGDWLIQRIQKEVISRVMKPVKNQLLLKAATLGNRAGLVGAASWVLRNPGMTPGGAGDHLREKGGLL